MSKAKTKTEKKDFTVNSILSRTITQNLGTAQEPTLAQQLLNKPGEQQPSSPDPENPQKNEQGGNHQQTPGITGGESNNTIVDNGESLTVPRQTGEKESTAVIPGKNEVHGENKGNSVPGEQNLSNIANGGAPAQPGGGVGERKTIKGRDYMDFGRTPDGKKKHSHYSTEETAELLETIRIQLFPKAGKNDFIENILRDHIERYLPDINHLYEVKTKGAIPILIAKDQLYPQSS